MNENLITGLDIGSGKILGITGYLSDTGIDILGTEIVEVPENFITKGRITDIEGVTNLLFDVFDSLSEQVKERISYVTIGIGGGYVKGSIYSKKIEITPNGREINKNDIQFLKKEIKNSIMAGKEVGEKILTILPQFYIIDGHNITTKLPIGMHGNTLEMKVLAISVEINPVKDIGHCIESAGGQIEHIFPHAWASGEATLTEEEKEMGCLLIDMGKGTTDIAIYFKNTITEVASFRIGGWNIDNDLSTVLYTPIELAEELKINYGYCNYLKMKENKDPKLLEEIEISSPSGKIIGKVTVEKISEIVYARVTEILYDYVKPVVVKNSLSVSLAGGVIITGGCSKLKGIIELSSDIFKLPVRIGVPIKTYNLDKNFQKPEYSSAFGLITLASKQLKERQKSFYDKLKEPFAKIKKNFKKGLRKIK